MLIKLTNLNNEIILINPNFLLTVEPNETGSYFQMRSGQSTLSGDVKETPDEILKLIQEAENETNANK